MRWKGFWTRTREHHGCWLWLGPVNRKGYGVISRKIYGESLAHRQAWVECRGPIPRDACVLHCCDHPACIYPGHLFLGSLSDNNADMRAKGRDARCERNGIAKLTNAEAGEIRATTTGSHVSIARRFGVHQTTITRLKAGHTWRSL